jgi:hypothetical protein
MKTTSATSFSLAKHSEIENFTNGILWAMSCRCAASSWNGVFGWPQPSGGALHSAFEGLIAENNFDDAFGGFKVRFQEAVVDRYHPFVSPQDFEGEARFGKLDQTQPEVPTIIFIVGFDVTELVIAVFVVELPLYDEIRAQGFMVLPVVAVGIITPKRNLKIVARFACRDVFGGDVHAVALRA